MDLIDEKILVPTIHNLRKVGRPFRGILYAGLMMTNQGPRVLEYNVRFGDPEAQPVLMRLKSDLAEVLLAAREGRLNKLPPLEWDPRPAVCVVMASEGYPGEYEKGKVIRGLAEADALEDVKVFHAGTKLSRRRSRHRRRPGVWASPLWATTSPTRNSGPIKPSKKSASTEPGAAKTFRTRRGRWSDRHYSTRIR